MLKPLRHFLWILSTSGALSLGFGIASAATSPRSLPQEIDETPNISYLNQVTVPDSPEKEFARKWLDPGFADESRQAYQDLTRDHDLRSKYSLTDPYEEQIHKQRIEAFQLGLIDRVRQYQTRQNLRKLRKAVTKDPNIKKIEKPIAVAAAIAGAYTGVPFDFRLNDDLRFRARTDFVQKNGELEIATPIFNGRLDMTAPPPVGTTPNLMADRTERFRYSVSRDLPLIDVKSGFSYGSTTSTLSASLSKEVASNLTCVVDTTRPVNAGATDAASPGVGEDKVRLLYGIHF